jgi:hypothetical protein
VRRRLLEIGASAVGLFVVALVLWPPRYVYWGALADVIGPVAASAAAVIAAALVGAAVGTLSGVALRHLATGGVIAYAAVGYGIEVATSPESPVHLYLYGWLLGSVLLGATLARAYRGDVDPGLGIGLGDLRPGE